MTIYVNEIWKPVVGYEGLYSISSIGRLRIEKSSQNTPSGTITIGCKDKHYMKVSLRKNGARITDNIHVLVAEAFICPRPEGMYTNHIDGNKLNNCASNLEWVTPKENSRQSVIAGKHYKGSKVFGSKLKEDEVSTIKSLLNNKHSCASIGRSFNVSRAAISEIKREKSWKHITLKNAGIE